MSTTTLVTHCGAREVSREELNQIEAPPPTQTWYPVRHSTVVESVSDLLRTGGFEIQKATYAVSRQGGARMFATLDLATSLCPGVSLAVTGKSPSSIRRIIYPVIHDDKHTDRGHIQPSVEEAMQLRVKGENFAWKLSEELLRREMPADSAATKVNPPSATKLSGHAEQDLLAMLQGELQIKNQQIVQQGELISKQMELISGLSERLREGNILIGSLQQHLGLPDGRGATSTVSIKTKRAPSTEAEKGSTIASKTPKPRKSFLSRLFG